MALTNAQIIAIACTTARLPGLASTTGGMAGQLYNSILSELCQNYDFAVARGTYNFNFSASLTPGQPELFPSDYLRALPDECWYTISAVPYKLIPVDLAEYDSYVQITGFSGFPYKFATDTQPLSTGGQPKAYFWSPPSGAYAATVRYQQQKADITNPETSSASPWFPDTNYLITRLSGEIMKISDDERHSAWLSDNEEAHPEGAGVLLRRYLKMKDDKINRSQRVTLDRRFFGSSYANLRNTKTIGW